MKLLVVLSVTYQDMALVHWPACSPDNDWGSAIAARRQCLCWAHTACLHDIIPRPAILLHAILALAGCLQVGRQGHSKGLYLLGHGTTDGSNLPSKTDSAQSAL